MYFLIIEIITLFNFFHSSSFQLQLKFTIGTEALSQRPQQMITPLGRLSNGK